MEKNIYLENRRQRNKIWFRLRLGVEQIIIKPYLLVGVFVIVLAGIITISQKQRVLSFLKPPELMWQIYDWIINAFCVLIPFLFLVGFISLVGELVARKDEGDIAEAFTTKDLHNGSPILIMKRHLKGTDVTVREFYSSIPFKRWVERMDEIGDALNVHFVEKIEYGGKSHGRRVVLKTSPGRKAKEQGVMYDDEF